MQKIEIRLETEDEYIYELIVEDKQKSADLNIIEDMK